MPSDQEYIDAAIGPYIEFLNHHHAINKDLYAVKREDFDESGPYIVHKYTHGDWTFGALIIISQVDPYRDEGGPASLICLFAINPHTGQVEEPLRLKWMAQNFDTLTTEIYNEQGVVLNT